MVRDMRGMRGKVPRADGNRCAVSCPGRRGSSVGRTVVVLVRSGRMILLRKPCKANDPTGGLGTQAPAIKNMWMQVSLTKGNPQFSGALRQLERLVSSTYRISQRD